MSDCSIFVRKMQEKNVSPMPFIGLYIAAASLLCTLAILLHSLDIYVSIITGMKRTAYSGKFFTLNATSLTLLAVATKLTGDLTSPMWSARDNLAKIVGTAFLTISMGSFFTTLGYMNDKDILTNVTALSILVITVLVDLCIQLSTGALDYSLFPEIIYAIVLLVCMLITLVCSALAVPVIKKHAESKYQTIHQLLSDNEQMEGQQHTVEELKLSIRKYWVMAASGSPQFMVTRLATFIITGNICLLSAIISQVARSRTKNAFEKWTSHCQQESDYKWSVPWILAIQFWAVLWGYFIDIAISLCFMRSKYEDNGIKLNREEFTVESYWTEKLVEWRQSSIPMRIKRGTVRKLLHNIKGLILTFCIRVQTVVVMCCKFCCVVYFFTMLPLLFLCYHLDKLVVRYKVSNDQSGPETDHNRYIVILEGEKQLPKNFLRIIINEVDKHIKNGKMKQLQNLFNLLNESFSFGGVIEFDSNRVPSLLSDEPPNCWTLPVVTLTSIAIALPNIAIQHVDWLVSSVDEALHYASLIDVLDEKHGLKSSKSAADVVWVGVELQKKWLDMDLERKTGEVNSAKEIIQALAAVAERTVREFRSTGNRMLVENPLYWPANVLAANSMYRIGRTILLYYENCECRAEELFRRPVCMIADILAACLTNLPHVIATKYSCNAIEEREKSVRDAAILLGETEHILKHFEERKLSSICPSQPSCIDEWRHWMERQVSTVSVSATSKGTPSTVESNEEHVVLLLSSTRP